MLMTSATKLVEPVEVVRLTPGDLNRLEVLARKRGSREMRLKDCFDVNGICVRTVTEKKRMRNVPRRCTAALTYASSRP